MTKVPYVHSGYDRIKDDNYQTVDPRCVDALVHQFCPYSIVDVCAPSGSGIVDRFIEIGLDARGVADAFDDTLLNRYVDKWIVTNPPYTRPLVDDIIKEQIERIDESRILNVAMLLRSNFDFAKSRVSMFKNNPLYRGQIKMLFRPIWIEGEQRAQPIHNFVWHIWQEGYWNNKEVWYVEE